MSTSTTEVMGTVGAVLLRDDKRARSVVDDVFAWWRDVDARFSPYRPESEISRIDRGELAVDDAHDDVRWVLDHCAQLRADTAGYFDERCRGRLDPSALVKGWAVDRAAAMLRDHGSRDFCVELGGDLVACGRPAPGERWRVGIQHPWRRDRVAAVIEIEDAAVATSGHYERGDHIVDPTTGVPVARGLVSLTLVGPRLADADALSTAAFAMGPEVGPWWAASLQDHEAMAILDGDVLNATPGFDAMRVC